MSHTKQGQRTTQRKRGNRLGFLFFEMITRGLGLRVAYSFLYLVCAYYLLFDRDAVAAAMPYVVHRFPDAGWFRRRWHVYRLFINQGEFLLDRYALISGYEGFQFDLKGFDELSALIEDSKRGIILLTSHIGNWQIAMPRLEKLKKRVYLLMRPEDNPAVHQSLKIRQEGDMISFISPDGYLGGIVEIMNALRQGQIVSIMADRTYGAEGVPVSFLGDRAVFPHSAFKIAAATETPMMVLLSAKTAPNRYLVDVSHVFDWQDIPQAAKKGVSLQRVQTFADLLTTYAESYPYQCFFFYDVWESTNPC